MIVEGDGTAEESRAVDDDGPSRVDGPGRVAAPSARLTLGLLCSYLFFLARRPVSRSNKHYLSARLEGIKSLVPLLLEGGPSHALRLALDEVQRTTPANFSQRAQSLQLRLLSIIEEVELPSDFAVTRRSPAISWPSIEKVRLVVGPSIGIGDEFIAMPIARSLQKAGVRDIEVLTTYPAIWREAQPERRVRGYLGHRELLDALHSPRRADEVNFLVDFEKPGLASLVAGEASPCSYVELSLGAQTTLVVDTVRRVFHAYEPCLARLSNYYHGLDDMLPWLGLSAIGKARFAAPSRSRGEGADLRVFVSPFTSKYDPSPRFWARLTSEVFSGLRGRAVCLRLDPGANRETARFTEMLSLALTQRLPANVSVEVARPNPESANLKLDELMQELRACDLALCTDSWVAHAAPACGCPSIVMAGPRLQNWRVPAPSSFYFDADAPVEELAASMRCVVRCRLGAAAEMARPSLPVLQASAALLRAGERLEGAIESGGFPSLADWDRFLFAYECAIDGLGTWPDDYSALFGDADYARRFRRGAEGLSEAEFRAYVCDQVEFWSDSNLRKYLGAFLPSIRVGFDTATTPAWGASTWPTIPELSYEP